MHVHREMKISLNNAYNEISMKEGNNSHTPKKKKLLFFDENRKGILVVSKKKKTRNYSKIP